MKEFLENNRERAAVPWITLDDLIKFKAELLHDIEALLQNNGQNANKRWLKTYEVRKLLNISAGTLQTLRLNGTLPYTKMGGALYYEYKDIENLLEKEKVVKKWRRDDF